MCTYFIIYIYNYIYIYIYACICTYEAWQWVISPNRSKDRRPFGYAKLLVDDVQPVLCCALERRSEDLRKMAMSWSNEWWFHHQKWWFNHQNGDLTIKYGENIYIYILEGLRLGRPSFPFLSTALAGHTPADPRAHCCALQRLLSSCTTTRWSRSTWAGCLVVHGLRHTDHLRDPPGQGQLPHQPRGASAEPGPTRDSFGISTDQVPDTWGPWNFGKFLAYCDITIPETYTSWTRS